MTKNNELGKVVSEIREGTKKMKFSKKHYAMIEENIRAFDREKIVQYKSQLLQKVESKEIAVNSFDVRFIFDVYYACVPQPVRMKIREEGDYKDNHIKTAVKTALQKLEIL